MLPSPLCSWPYLSSVWHLPYVFQRKSKGFPSSCSVTLSLRVSNVAFECRSCLQAGWPFPWRVHFWEPFSRIHPWPPFPCVQRMWIFHILYRTFGWHYWHIWNRQPRILPSLTSARISSSVLPTPTTLSSLNTPWLLSATTTLVEPERFFFLRTNMPQR